MHGSSGDGANSTSAFFANVFISFVGAGILGLPYAFRQAGVAEAVLLMVCCGILSVKAMLLLVECKYQLLKTSQSVMPKLEGSVSIDYGDLARGVFGDRGWWAVQACIVLSQIGFCCAYLIFISQNLHTLLPSVSTSGFLALSLVPLVFLCNIRDLSKLGVFSLTADCATLFAFGVVFYFDFSHFRFRDSTWPMFNLEQLPFFFGVSVYCYEGAGMVISLEESLPVDQRSRFPFLFSLSLAVVTSLYIVFAIAGEMSFGDTTQKIITLNLPSGMFPLLVKGCLCFSLLFTFPVMMFPVSTLLDKQLSKGGEGLSPINGVFLRASLVAVTALVVVVIPDFATIMGLIGSTCGMLLAFIMPGLLHLRYFGKSLSVMTRTRDWVIVGLGVIGMLLGTRDAVFRVLYPDDYAADGEL
eukprot:m.47883 g.47883  ORF g.47883 m.47883 type:complete len:413 (+) comp11953_c0_seq1:316-1554(+)